MGDWQKTIDALVEAWEKFTTSIKRDGGCPEQGVWSFVT